MATYSIQKNFLWTYLHSTIDAFKVKLLGYKSYKVFLTQSGVNAPEAVVLENTLGTTGTYFYTNPGYYAVAFDRFLFADPISSPEGNRVEVTITPNYSTEPSLAAEDIEFVAWPIFFNAIGIQSINKATPANEDGWIGDFCSVVLEIKVYNK